MTDLVALESVSLTIGARRILNEVSLDIQPREILTVIGPNGAGKSSLVKVLLGLTPPSSGRRLVGVSTRFGYVPQRLSLSPTMPMKVSRFMSLARIDKQSRNEFLTMFGVDHLLGAPMQGLSGGELQRVLLARAAARCPDVLVLDEPLQGVDVNGQVNLYRAIASLREHLGCGILMVSHDLHLVMAQTDAVICLNQHVCCHGRPESVSQHPEYLRLFGEQSARDLAVYQHHHDHDHDVHGDPVRCEDGSPHA